jgi:hypothetical protein
VLWVEEPMYPEKTTNLLQVNDKLYHIKSVKMRDVYINYL